MLYEINLPELRIIENIGDEALIISIDRLENRLNKLLPKVDKTSNWISAIGIFVALILGVISYACVEEKYRPSLGLTIPLVIVILLALGFTVYMLYKSYKAISVEKIMEELQKAGSNARLSRQQPKVHNTRQRPRHRQGARNQMNNRPEDKNSK